MATTSDARRTADPSDSAAVEPVADALDPVHAGAQRQHHARRPHVVGQHADDLFGAVVAEQLAQGLLVPGDARLIDPFDEVVLA